MDFRLDGDRDVELSPLCALKLRSFESDSGHSPDALALTFAQPVTPAEVEEEDEEEEFGRIGRNGNGSSGWMR